MTPLKVNVDLNKLLNEDKTMYNFKNKQSQRSNDSVFSKSFQNSQINSRNQKNFVQSSYNSFDSGRVVFNCFNKSKESIYRSTETVHRKDKTFGNINNLDSSIYFSKMKIKDMNFNIDSPHDNKKSTKDSSKNITIKNSDLESIEDMHFLFVKFLRQSKIIEDPKTHVKNLSTNNNTITQLEEIDIKEIV